MNAPLSIERTPTGDGLGWEVERVGYRLRIPRRLHGRKRVKTADFTSHPLRDLVVSFLLRDADSRPGGTLCSHADSMERLDRAMKALGVRDLSAEVFHAVTAWLGMQQTEAGDTRWSEHQVATTLSDTISLYDFGIGRQLGWTRAELDVMEMRRLYAMRGKGRRTMQRSIDKTISDNEFVWLFRAIQWDLATLRERQGRSSDGLSINRISESDQPNPFVVLALMLVICHGIRSSELNVMEVGHIRADEARLSLVPPDKPPSEVLMSQTVVELFRMCVAWGAHAREELGCDLLFCHTTYKVPTRRPTREGMATRSTHLTTKMLNEYYLPRFYDRHFETRVRREGREQPLLHRERTNSSEPPAPFYCSFKKLRNAFVRVHMDTVDDPAETQRVARHKHYQTTVQSYTHRDRLGSARRVAAGLRRTAAVVGLSLRSRVTPGTAEERAELASRGRLTPHGGCAEPGGVGGMPHEEGREAAIGCRVHPDCVTCPHAELHASVRPVLVNDRDALLILAEQLEAEGYQREAENRRTRAAYLQAQVDRIDYVLEEWV